MYACLLCSPTRGGRADGFQSLREFNRRRETQPLRDATAGCVFRNPEVPGAPSAGALIDGAGLKGAAVGGAAVSELHANFLINAGVRCGRGDANGSATAAEIRALVGKLQAAVKEQTGYELATEIRVVPYDHAPPPSPSPAHL